MSFTDVCLPSHLLGTSFIPRPFANSASILEVLNCSKQHLEVGMRLMWCCSRVSGAAFTDMQPTAAVDCHENSVHQNHVICCRQPRHFLTASGQRHETTAATLNHDHKRDTCHWRRGRLLRQVSSQPPCWCMLRFYHNHRIKSHQADFC